MNVAGRTAVAAMSITDLLIHGLPADVANALACRVQVRVNGR
jgi:hypothetical protein